MIMCKVWTKQRRTINMVRLNYKLPSPSLVAASALIAATTTKANTVINIRAIFSGE